MNFLFLVISLASIYLISLFVLHEKKIRRTQKNLGKEKNLLKSNRNLKNISFVRYCIYVTNIIFCLIAITLCYKTFYDKAINNNDQIIFGIDVSQSMQARDADQSSNINRLELARSFIEKFINNNPQFRYGLVQFTSEAKLISPLTSDKNIILTLLQKAHHSQIKKQGSDINSAIELVNKKYKTQDVKIVIISDGEIINKSQNVYDFENDKKIYTIGVGSKKGAKIPIKNTILGKQQYKTYQGKIVISALEDDILQSLADDNRGSYTHLKGVNFIDTTIEKIVSQLYFSDEKNEINIDAYRYALLIACIIYIIDLLIYYEAFAFIKKRNMYVALVICIMFASGCSIQDGITIYTNNNAVKDFYNEDYSEASKKFFSLKNNTTYKDTIYYNLCTSYYQENEFEKAWEYCRKGVEKNDNDPLLWYNLGNTYYRLGELYQQSDIHRTQINWQQAIQAYNKTLNIRSNDIQAQENRDFVMKKLLELGTNQSQKSNTQRSQNKNRSGNKSQNTSDSDQDGESQKKDLNSRQSNNTNKEPLNDEQVKRLENMLKEVENEEREWQGLYGNFGDGYTQQLDALRYPSIVEDFLNGNIVTPFGDTILLPQTESATPDW
jgi:Ca-activated chloride channel family protein